MTIFSIESGDGTTGFRSPHNGRQCCERMADIQATGHFPGGLVKANRLR